MSNETNAYLVGTRAQPEPTPVPTWVQSVVVLPIIVLVLTASDPATPAVRAVAIAALVSLLAASVFAPARVIESRRRELGRAVYELYSGDRVAAAGRLRSILATRLTHQDHRTALMHLGVCALYAGDFAFAAEILGRAAAPAPGGARRAADDAPTLAAIAMTRSFALAAAGRVDVALAVLDRPPLGDVSAALSAHAVSTRALVHARRGETAQLKSLLCAEDVSIREHLSVADRWILAAVVSGEEPTDGCVDVVTRSLISALLRRGAVRSGSA